MSTNEASGPLLGGCMTPHIPDGVRRVYITEELTLRAAAKPDYYRETIALHQLSRDMMDSPDSVLPRLVDLAIELCGAVSGGISLYEDSPPPGIFRWHHLRGDLARFSGATTPRNYSPCGITLDLRTPVLVQRPERVYDWLVTANVSLPECLLVPLYLGGKDPLGTLWIVAGREPHFDSSHSEIMLDLAAFTGIAVRMVHNEQRLREAVEQQETITCEMNHRVRNLFAVAEALLRSSGSAAKTPKELAEKLSTRLHALAAAHRLVRPAFTEAGELREVTDLADLLRTILRPYPQFGAGGLEGPKVDLRSGVANSLALIFHELATNAAKYGALSVATGRVDVAWSAQEGNMIIEWNECDGPRVNGVPCTKGFGSALAEKTIVAGMGGAVSYLWKPDGLAVRLSIPLSHL
jgi:two-component sensor histidine kinase